MSTTPPKRARAFPAAHSTGNTDVASLLSVAPDHRQGAPSSRTAEDLRALSDEQWSEMVTALDRAQTNHNAGFPDTAESQTYRLAAQRWDAYLHTRPDVVRALVHSPHLLLAPRPQDDHVTGRAEGPRSSSRLDADRPSHAAPGSGTPPVAVLPAGWDPDRRWRVLAACTDLLWHYLERTAPTHSHHRRLLPLAARSRFLALTHPFRAPDTGPEQGLGNAMEREKD
ncbi:hypothetical protein, partial [Nocardiopsis dassonvillei]|uniref:hypothetical protein n=1 Tax=Nocardiopsis dassonvillei TaxID=2014 RepID=UPI00200C3433